MTLEDFIFPLFFASILLFRVVVPWLRGRQSVPETGTAQPPEQDPEDEPATEAEPQGKIPSQAPARAPHRAQTRDRARLVTSGPAPSLVAAEHRALLAPVTSLGDARRAIVLMTMLGPCRALEDRDTPRPPPRPPSATP